MGPELFLSSTGFMQIDLESSTRSTYVFHDAVFKSGPGTYQDVVGVFVVSWEDATKMEGRFLSLRRCEISVRVRE